MRLPPLLLFGLWLCACVASCAAPGAGQLDQASQVKPPQINQPAELPAIQPPAMSQTSALSPLPTPAPVLSWDSQSRNLGWYYENPGDYNQDGETNLADLTQIATYFGASQPYDETGLASVADGDGNGEVNLADIAPIAVNFRNRINKYNVYSSTSVDDVPAEPAAANGAGAQLSATVFLPDAVVAGGPRKAFALQQNAGIDGVYFWLRTVENNLEGLASNAVLVSEGAVAALVVQPASGTAPLRVTFDGSLSSGGAEPITSYRWDFDGDGVVDLDSGQQSVVEYVYHNPGSYVAKLTVATANSASIPATQPVSVSPAGFAFTPWDETFIGGGSAGGFKLTINDLGSSLEVEIYSDNAIGLAAVFGALSYDQSSLRFTGSLPGTALELQGGLLSFTQVVPDSRLHLGYCMVAPQDKAGIFGDHLLATVVFSREPEPPLDLALRVPLDSASAISDLSASRLDHSLAWRYNSAGDYNQDGTVQASDLAVLAFYWQLGGPYNQNSTVSLADGDGDLLVGVGDVGVLRANYYQSLAGFNVYGSSDPADYPVSATAQNGSGAQLLGYLSQNAGVGNRLENRLRYEFKVPGDSLPDFLWVRPVLGNNEGVPGNLVEPSTEFFISPDWTDSDWDEVTGSGASPATPLLLGATGDGRTFSFIASTQPAGQGSLIDIATLNWRVLPESSGTIAEDAVFIPRTPIAIGFIVADDGVGGTSNQLYFFAGSTPGG